MYKDGDFDRVISPFIGIAEPKSHFDKIVTRLNEKVGEGYLELTLSERYDLFCCLQNINHETKALRDLTLFTNFRGETLPLRRLLKPQSGGIHLQDFELDVKSAFEIQQHLAEYLCT